MSTTPTKSSSSPSKGRIGMRLNDNIRLRRMSTSEDLMAGTSMSGCCSSLANNNNNESNIENNNNGNKEQNKIELRSLMETQKQKSYSALPSSSSIEWLPTDGVTVDRCLGSGAFASVYSVRSIHTFDKDGKNEVLYGVVCKKYALKCLHRDTLRSTKKTKIASNDLKTEVTLLSGMPAHENIVRLHAVSEDFFDDPSKGYIILDRLSSTLSDRLFQWRARLQNQKANAPKVLSMMMKSSSDRQKITQQSLEHGTRQQDRIENVGIGLAKALEFLHEQNILYRDLKVDNIGFSFTGIVQLFDFGLSKKIEVDDDGLPNKRLTKFVGTPRYMAPEVISTSSYGFSADIYSYSVLLWEVITLQKPYGQPKSLQHLIKLVEQGTRPPLRVVCNRDVKKLISDGWNDDPSVRPSMAQIVKQLTTNTTVAQQIVEEQQQQQQQQPQRISGGASAA